MKSISVAMIIVVLFLGHAPSYGAGEQGGYAGSFLEWGAGSRAIALGKTFTGVADDGTALFWNPAGLSQMKKNEVFLMHALIFEDRQQNFFSLTYPLPVLTLSVGWMRFGVSDIQERDEQGQLLGHFSDAENIFILGAGMTVLDNAGLTLRAGLAGRYFYHSVYNYHGSGFGIDAGGMLTYGLTGILKRVGVSAVVQNIGAGIKWNTGSGHQDNVPVGIRIGAIVEAGILPALVAIDLEKKQNQDLRLHAGVEYTWQVLALRLGVNDKKFTAGAGVVVNLEFLEVVIDYAYTTDDVGEKALHFISLRGRF